MTLAQELRDAGLTVREYLSWQTRGHRWFEGQPIAVMHHHTAAPVPFPVSRLIGDRLKANINTKPDGTVWLLAQGACNYSSGPGSGVVLGEARNGTPPSQNARERGLTDNMNGNPFYWNFENDHEGDGRPIPQVQLDAIVVSTQVVLKHFGLDAGNVISHAEWTRRKTDPFWNNDRRCIEAIRAAIHLEDNLLPINASSHKEDIRLFQLLAGGTPSGDWDTATRGLAMSVAQASGTNDPKGKDGTHVNGTMFAHLHQSNNVTEARVRELIEQTKLSP